MVWNRVSEIKLAKPPIGQIDMNLLTEPSLRANALALAQQQHPDHQLRVNRRTAMRAVRWCEKRANLGQIKKSINAT